VSERKIWQEIVDYLVRVDLDKLGIDEKQFEEMQELFKMFDNDRDGVLSLKEFERLMGVLGRAG
jgi:Ca2+-binding EF-hand superfamily protein